MGSWVDDGMSFRRQELSRFEQLAVLQPSKARVKRSKALPPPKGRVAGGGGPIGKLLAFVMRLSVAQRFPAVACTDSEHRATGLA